MLSCHLGKTSRRHNSCGCSVAKSCHTLFDPMDYSTPGFPVLQYLTEFAQTHVHWICNASQSSNPLLLPFLPSLSLSQHQGFFLVSWLIPSASQSTGVSALVSVLPMNIQGWFPLGLTSPCCPRDSQVFSNTIQRHDRGMFKFLRSIRIHLNFQAIVPWVPVPSHPLQLLVWSVFLILAILISVWWYLILICIF